MCSMFRRCPSIDGTNIESVYVSALLGCASSNQYLYIKLLHKLSLANYKIHVDVSFVPVWLSQNKMTIHLLKLKVGLAIVSFMQAAISTYCIVLE